MTSQDPQSGGPCFSKSARLAKTKVPELVVGNLFSRSARLLNAEVPKPVEFSIRSDSASFPRNGYLLDKKGQEVNFGRVEELQKLSTIIKHPSHKERSCSVFFVRTDNDQLLNVFLARNQKGAQLVLHDMHSGHEIRADIPDNTELKIRVGESIRFCADLKNVAIKTIAAMEDRGSSSLPSIGDLCKPNFKIEVKAHQ
jgi:hypothetical protein